MRKIIMKIGFLIISISILIITASTILNNKSDKYYYSGEYKGVYTIAINKIPGIKGYYVNERRFEPEIQLLEEDDYGRKLYLYKEYSIISPFNYIIVQQENNSEVCIYSNSFYFVTNDESIESHQIHQLKELNHWNEEIHSDLLSCRDIELTKEGGPLETYTVIESLKNVSSNEEWYNAERFLEYYNEDEYGRSVYYTINLDYDTWIFIIFGPDGSFDSENGYIISDNAIDFSSDFFEWLDSCEWNEPLK